MGTDLNPSVKVKWYYRPVPIVVAIICAGPFALPLVWMSPALKRWHKALFTLATIAFTVWTVKASIDLFKILMRDMRDLQSAIK